MYRDCVVMCLAGIAERRANVVRKPIIRYATLHSMVAVGQMARVVPSDHYITGLNGCRVFVGPVLLILERQNDNRPVFETSLAIFIPDDVKSQRAKG